MIKRGILKLTIRVNKMIVKLVILLQTYKIVQKDKLPGWLKQPVEVYITGNLYKTSNLLYSIQPCMK